VIFDIDGTLVDSVGLIIDCYQYGFRTVLGHEWDEAEIRTWIGASLVDSLQRVCPEHADELFQRYVEWNAAHCTSMRAYPGIPELAGALVAAGVRLGVVTSKRQEPAVQSLALGGLTQAVTVIVSHDDTTAHKPDPEPLLLAVERLGCAVSDAVYVGDSLMDVQAAQAAGLDCVAVTWGAGEETALRAAGPTAVCDTVDALRGLLLG